MFSYVLNGDNIILTNIICSECSMKGSIPVSTILCSTRASLDISLLPQANFKSLVARDFYIHSAKESLEILN